MTRATTSRLPLLLFALSLTAIYGAALAIASRLTQLERADLIAGALTFDLTLLVPLLYYLLLVRWRGLPAVTVVPVFLVCAGLASVLIPETHHQMLDLVYYAAGLAELSVIVFIVYKLVQLRRAYRQRAAAGLDVPTALRESASSILGPVAGNALAYELALFYFAVAGWRRSPQSPPESSFGYHRASAYVPFAIGILIAVVIETVAVHALVRLWSPVTAWIFTAISIYSAVWVVGDTQAVRLRPIVVADGTLRLRLGLRWSADIPVTEIESVNAITALLPRKTPEYLKAVLLGAPNRRLRLRVPVCALGPYGFPRQVSTLDLQLDEPERFDTALKQAGCNVL